MRVLSRLTMVVLSGLLLGGCDTNTGGPELPPAVGRPDGASQGPRAAVIVAVRGTAEIQPSQGLAFPARAEQQLLRDDRIVTGPDSLVVVALHNQHVVRLNPGTLRVDAIAMFDERPAGDDLQQRFEQLLTPDERQDPALRGAIARVAGWNTRMTAAETIAPQPAADRSAPPSAPKPTEEDGESKPGAPVDPMIDKPTSDIPTSDVEENAKVELKNGAEKKAPTKKKSTSPDDADEAGGSLKNPFPSNAEPGTESTSSPSPPPANKKSEDERVPGLPDQVNFRPDDGGKLLRVSLPTPLAAVRASLAACAGPGVKIRVHVVGKKITELKVNGVASKCEPGLLGKSVGLADGWIELQVQ
jgi:hypothetical protein